MKTYLGACAAGLLALAVIVTGAGPLPEAAWATAGTAQPAHAQRVHAHRSIARHGSTPWLLRAMSAAACVATLTAVPRCPTAPALNL